MRQIERQLRLAIIDNRDFKKGNTEFDANSGEVKLFGNTIATISRTRIRHLNNGKFGGTIWSPFVNTINLCSYPTSTTLSRLRCLNLNIYKKKGIVYFQTEKVKLEVPREGQCNVGQFLE